MVTVYDANGNAAEDALLRLTKQASKDPYPEQLTDPSGLVLFQGLRAGQYSLYATIEQDDVKVMEEVRDNITLVAGQRAEVTFGSPTGLSYWYGSLRTSGGDLVTGASSSDRAKLVLWREGTDSLTPFFVDSSGHFALRIQPGEYRMRVSPYDSPDGHLKVPNMVIEPGSMHQDVTLPGTRLVIQAILATSDLEYGTLRLQGEGRRPRIHETTVRGQGEYVFDGVVPGTWTLDGSGVTSPLKIQVSEESSWLTQTVVLR